MGASREHRQRLYEQLVGQSIGGRFKITSLLGFGGMGAVYQALQTNMQRDVALKVIPSHDPTTTARFKREALTISQLHHPNTVTVFDYGETDNGLLYLAMEMLSGHTLSELIEKVGPLSPNQAVHIAMQVCRSLSEAHESNIVHRDIKPDNIFLIEVDDDPNFVKVLDFGIAKIVRGEDNVDLTGTGRIIGTPKYMSPEQILAEAVDNRSDIYSLACILFEMLCGGPPFQESSTTKLMLAHAHQAPPTFSERLPNQARARIPGPLEQVVRRALSKSASQRQPTIDAFRDELEEALEATDHELRISQLTADTQMHPATIEPTTTADRGELTDSSDLLAQHSSQTLAKLKPPTGLQPAPTADVEADEPAAQQGSSGSKGAIYAIVGALVLISGLGAYMFLQPPEDNQPPSPSPGDQPAVAATQPPSAEPSAPAEAAPEKDKPADDEQAKPVATAEVKVRILTEPDDADVFEQGRYIGKTPLIMMVEPGAVLEYEFERDGYHAKTDAYTVEAGGDEPQVFEVDLEKKPAPRRTRRTRPPRPKPQKRDPSPAPEQQDDHEVADKADEKPEKVKPSVGRLVDDEPKANVPTVE